MSVEEKEAFVEKEHLEQTRPNYFLAARRLALLVPVIVFIFIPEHLVYLLVRRIFITAGRVDLYYWLGAARTHFWFRFVQIASGITLTVQGRVPVGTMIISNHRSYLDIVACAAATRMLFVGEASIARQRWPIGRIFRTSGQIAVDQKQGRQGVLAAGQEIKKRLISGVPVWVSISNSITEEGGVEQPKKSFTFFAAQNSITTIPCYIRWRVHTPGGSVERDIVSPRTGRFRDFVRHFIHFLGRRVSVTIFFGTPVVPYGQPEWEYLLDVHHQLFEQWCADQGS